MPVTFSSRMSRIKASPIRDILSVAARPGMISFAGGLPARESFPALEQLTFERDDLQYGPSEGEPYLREQVAKHLGERGLHVEASQVLIVSGSQQGIDLVAKLMIDEGTRVAVESPTYLAALQVFTLFGARYVPFDIDQLDETLAGSPPKLLYTIPTFQNPSSRVYTQQQRKALASACDAKNLLLFEDDPYRELCYDECDRIPVCSMMRGGNWIYQSTFSKTIAPGLRLAYMVCSPELYPALLKLKQAADLHSSRISQRLVGQILNAPDAQVRLKTLQHLYRLKRDQFNDALSTHFGGLASWQIPAGGLFFWLRLNTAEPVDTMALLSSAIEAGVTFMPGEPFFADGRDAAGYLRLNFSNADVEEYDAGLSLLSTIVEAAI